MNIRNFCIIAHIDHGKSTLADRLLELTHTLEKREMKHGQMLDMMDLEQERGITIKLAPVRMEYDFSGRHYILNLIDTPGHVDFSYEVSRSLAACEGAILIVDATQGIQAQTLANAQMAIEHGLTIIPVINKIDLPAADIERVKKEMASTLGVLPEEILAISAKEGTNVEKLLQAIIEKIPPPIVSENDQFKALIFDSVYDAYKGVVTYVRVKSGEVSRGDKVYFLHTHHEIEVLEVGYFKPKYQPAQKLISGEIGYMVTGLKEVREARVGDTIWRSTEIPVEQAKPLSGYKEVTPYVFASIFCVNNDEYPMLRDAIEKLKLNDSSLTYEPEHSTALGHGFRCGFLGLLHMDIVQERLEREYGLNLIVTAPSVSYKVSTTRAEEFTISHAAKLPDPTFITGIREPWVEVELLVPKESVGGVLKLVQDRRGIQKDMQFIDQTRMKIVCELPLASIVVDFYDKLKTLTQGYGSMNYRVLEYREGDLVRLDILVAGDRIDAMSSIVHRSEAYDLGAHLTQKLKELIPRAQFEIAVQAAIGSKILARETIPALRKDVTAKLYGGDRTRKDKLLKKQKAGKKRMKMMGKIEMPQEAFLAILKR